MLVLVGVTDTVAVALADAPLRVHVRVKLVVAVSAPVDAVPLVAFVPFHPPDAVHSVAFVELQVSVADPPLATLVGVAVNVTVAACGPELGSPAQAHRLAPSRTEGQSAHLRTAEIRGTS